MRIWTVHPRYLDRQGLLAAWREGLLAQKVLQGRTRGYQHHPQLWRFRQLKDPVQGIGVYLHYLVQEASARGYKFDQSKICAAKRRGKYLKTSRGQLQFESKHLLKKLKKRNPDIYRRWRTLAIFKPHPIFQITKGPIEAWERP